MKCFNALFWTLSKVYTWNVFTAFQICKYTTDHCSRMKSQLLQSQDMVVCIGEMQLTHSSLGFMGVVSIVRYFAQG